MSANFKALIVDESIVLRKEDDPSFRKLFPLSWKFMIDSYLKGMKASEIYAEGLRRGDPIRLVDLVELEESLKDPKAEKTGKLSLRRGLRELDLTPSWLEMTIFSFKVLGERYLLRAMTPVFYLLSAVTVVLALWQLSLPRDLGHFLFADDSYALSLVGLFLGLSGLAIAKSLLQLAMNLLTLGSLPEVRFSYRLLFVDLAVDSSVIDAHRDRTTRLIYYLTSAYAFVAAAFLLKNVKLPGLTPGSWVTLSYLMSFLALSPKSKGETSKLFGLLFPQWKAKRFLSYLENRALFAVLRRGRWLEDESNLLLFAVLCLGWSFSFLFFVAALLDANISLLNAQVKMASGSSWVSIIVILAIFALMLGLTVIELWRVLIRNFLFLFQRQIQNFRRNRSVRTEKEFDAGKIRRFFTESPLFQGLPDEVVDAFLKEGHIQALKPGHHIVLQGNVGKDLFMILDGEAVVRKQDGAGELKDIAQLSKGAIFGEIALLRNIVRTASVVALTPVRVFVLPKVNFQKIFAGLESAKKLEQRIALTGLVGDSSVFMNIPKETLQLMLGYGEFVEVGPGQVIMEQGDQEKDFYIMLRGHAEVIRAGGLKMAEIGPGGFFGEMALFENRARTAMIRSRDEVVALRLSREAFWKMVDQDLPLAANIQEVSWLRRQAPEALGG